MKRPERRFWVRLSLYYRIPVGELMQRMTGDEFIELLAWDRHISPIGDIKEDYRAALIAHTVAASQGAKSKLDDFVLDWERWGKSGEEKEAEIKAAFAAYRAMQGSKQ